MEISFLTLLLWSNFLIIVALWVYLLIYSYRHGVSSPWGFSIVIIGILVSGYGYTFYITSVGLFSINLLFLVSIFGILWNINNIRQQFYITNMGEFLRFIGIGLMFGLLFGFSIGALYGMEYFQSNIRYAPIALIASAIQVGMAEELLYRGYFLGYLRKYKFNQMSVIVFQALVFATMHISRSSGHWMAVFIIFLLGVVAGYLTWKNNNLIPAITMHIVSNIIGVIWWLAAT